MIIILSLLILIIIGINSQNKTSFDYKKNLSKIIFFVVIFIIFLFTLTISSTKKEKDCVPLYSQNPTQKQIDDIEKAKREGVYGDNYLLSKKIGCE